MEPATASPADPAAASPGAKPRALRRAQGARQTLNPATLTRISEAAAVAAVEAFYGEWAPSVDR